MMSNTVTDWLNLVSCKYVCKVDQWTVEVTPYNRGDPCRTIMPKQQHMVLNPLHIWR